MTLRSAVFFLTAADRCDVKNCGARAYAQAFMHPGTNALLFCGHHFAQHQSALEKVAMLVVDERDALNPPPRPVDDKASSAFV